MTRVGSIPLLHRIIAALLTLLGITPAAGAAPAGTPIAQGIDHVYLPAAKAGELHALMRDTLGLPEVWGFAARGGGSSGGVSLGNVVLELMERPGAGGSVIEGIALWPRGTSDVAVGQLRAAGLGRGRPVRTPSSRAFGGSGWVLTGLSDFPEGNVFLCEYLEPAAVRQGRQQAATALAAASGGPLGIIAVREIVIGARDPATQRSRWRLLAGATGDDPVVPFAQGPAVRVVPAARDAIQELVVEVLDPVRAAATRPESLRGLPIRFVPRTSP